MIQNSNNPTTLGMEPQEDAQPAYSGLPAGETAIPDETHPPIQGADPPKGAYFTTAPQASPPAVRHSWSKSYSILPKSCCWCISFKGVTTYFSLSLRIIIILIVNILILYSVQTPGPGLDAQCAWTDGSMHFIGNHFKYGYLSVIYFSGCCIIYSHDQLSGLQHGRRTLLLKHLLWRRVSSYVVILKLEKS